MTSARRAPVVVWVMLLGAASCGDNDSGTAGTSESVSVTNVLDVVTTSVTPPTSGSTTAGSPPATTGVGVVDPVAEILAAVASYWLSPVSYTTLHVVGRLGTVHSERVRYSDDSPDLSDEQRDSIAKALVPQAVLWVDDPDEVPGSVPPITLPDGEAIVMFAEPAIEGSRALVIVNLWCGMMCGGGMRFVVEQIASGEWRVTDQYGGYVS